MSQVQRICPQCAQNAPVESRHCPHCGYDAQGALPVQQNNLPAAIGKAALPVLAGVATLALRTAWRLLSDHMAEQALKVDEPPQQPATRQDSPQKGRFGRSIRIRSAWSVGDGNGNWRHGSSEPIVDFDD